MKPKSIRLLLMILITISFSREVFTQDSLIDVLPPDIHPVVILQGSNYEMGYQYGLQVGDLIEKRRNKVMAALVENTTPEYVQEGIKAIQYYIKKIPLCSQN